MHLFEHSSGTLFAFGYDILNQKTESKRLYWSDTDGSFRISTPNNAAGWVEFKFDLDPEFIRECDGKIVAYQPGKCIELEYIGPPFMWRVRTLAPQQGAELLTPFFAP